MCHKPFHLLLVIVFAALQLFAEELEDPPDRKIVIEDVDVTLPCMAHDSRMQVGITDVMWLRNGTSLKGNRYTMDLSGNLKIEKVRLNESGEYICHILGDFGGNSSSVQLIVKQRTHVALYRNEYEVIAGSKIIISCSILKVDPTLTTNVSWILHQREIDFTNNSNIIKDSDHSLVIRNATIKDAGFYVILVQTELDDARDYTFLKVVSVPEPPIINKVWCNNREAIIEWEPQEDGGAKILHYTIEYNTTFNPNDWSVSGENIPVGNLTYRISMIPWANYSFRVVAHNKAGPSKPSKLSNKCETNPEIPSNNPRDVRGEGTSPNNLVISWTPMPPIEHNGPGFHYKISWMKDAANEKWTEGKVDEWQQHKYIVENVPTYTRFRIKVEVANNIGETHTYGTEVTAYSGEGEPQAPTDVTLVNTGVSSAIIRWNPIPQECVNGKLSGYTIHVWNEKDGEDEKQIIHVYNDTTEVLITNLRRSSMNFARVYAHNTYYRSPSNDILEIMTPLPDPSSVQSFEALPLGSSSLLLRWTKPLQIFGEITGYNIYYIEDGLVECEREPQIDDPEITHAKLAGLKPNATYRLNIVTITNSVDGKDYFIDASTKANVPVKPDPPSFTWDIINSDDNHATFRVTWMPNLQGKPGSDFFVKYRIKNTQNWISTDTIVADDIINLTLPHGNDYEIMVVSVDGIYSTESDIQEMTSDITCPLINRKAIFVISTVTLSLAIAFAGIRLILHIYGKYKAIQGRKLSVHDTYGNSNNGQLYHINLNQLDFTSRKHAFVRNNAFDDLGIIMTNDVRQCKTTDDRQFIETKDYDVRIRRRHSFSGEVRLNVDFLVSNLMDGSLCNINPDLTLDEQADLLPYDRKYEFPIENLELGKQLGTGAFGVVFEAVAKGILPHEEQTTVAVKKIKKMADNEVLRALILELKILVHLGQHLNVVNLLGAVTKNIVERELMIISEYCEFGNLQNFLVKHRQHFIDQIIPETGQIDTTKIQPAFQPTNNNGYLLHSTTVAPPIRLVTTTDLLCWSFQIANGMNYLASRKVLHGDLAARNILLCDNNVVKICDFGLARSMYRTGNYRIKTERPLPYKWLALESIGDHVFSTYSDVWSYGIVLWELFSLGTVPYPGMIAGAALYCQIKNGYRMEKPEFSTNEIYEVMRSCWRTEPETRPLFHELAQTFSQLLGRDVSEHYMCLNEPYLRINKSHGQHGRTDRLSKIYLSRNQSLSQNFDYWVDESTGDDTQNTYL